MSVVAVEETPLLTTMQRVVRGIEVQPYLAWRRWVRVEKQIHQQVVQGIRIRSHLLVAMRGRVLWRGKLKAVERA